MFCSKSSGCFTSGIVIILKGVVINEFMPTPIMKKAIRIIEIAPYDVIFMKILKSRYRQTKIMMKNIMKEVHVWEKQ